jgi:hypothetical protein
VGVEWQQGGNSHARKAEGRGSLSGGATNGSGAVRLIWKSALPAVSRSNMYE